MHRNRPLLALAASLLFTSLAPAELLSLETRERLQQVRYQLREALPLSDVAVPMKDVVRGYALVLDGLYAGDSDDPGYWRRAARNRVQLAGAVGRSLLGLERSVGPSPAPVDIRADLRRVGARLASVTVDGNGDLDFWRSVSGSLNDTMAAQAAALHELVDRLHADAPDRVVPASRNFLLLSAVLGSIAPSGASSEESWRRAAEDQVLLARRMGLAVAGHVRHMAGPLRAVVRDEAAALRQVALRPAAELSSWHQEAQRLGAVLNSHQAVLTLFYEELR